MSATPQDADRRELLKSALRAVEDMRGRLDAAQRASSEPIAIIGLGCRMPGGVETPDAFWELLKNGVDPIREVPDERWPAELYARLAPDLAALGKPRAGFVDRLDAFDPHFFGISPREALTMDPQHRMVLETSWEALEHAGQAPDRLKGSLTGVFVGITALDYAVHLRVADRSNLDVYTATGSAHNAAAGRVSYILGLHGPSMAIDTACSSSLTAVHLACQSLRLKESDLALAGGVNTLIMPDWFVSMARWGMLAPDGCCKAFDAAADGMVRAEGCGIIVLKRLSDALASGDRILAVVRGSAVNQDGPSSGLTVPNGPAQEAVLRQTLRVAGVRPSDVSYVEAHGTGTTLGDPIELEALDAVLSEGRADGGTLIVGSVKSNVGHLESASGIAGLIKVVLSLQHEEIPANLHFHTLNPAITLRHLRVHVPTGPVPWAMAAQPRIAGVSSFGLSGSNAHVILEEAPRSVALHPNPPRPAHLLTISARTATALRTQAERWRYALAANPAVNPGDVAHTANTGRSALPHRAALLATSVAQFTDQLAALAEGQAASGLTTGQVRPKDRPRVVFLFTGQGSQYAGMARDLYRTQPVFRESLDRSDALLRSVLDRPLLSIVHPDSQDDASRLRINETGYTQPALFALEYALYEMWTAWGIKPVAVIGHSVGEYVAACAAGVFGLEEGLRLIAARGRLMQALPPGGAMSAVMAGEAAVREQLRGRWDEVSIAAVNGPANVVISGPATSVAAAVAALQASGVASQPLTVSHAFHSSLMDPMLGAFASTARSVTFAAPRIPLVSNLTGRLFEKGEIPGAEYWTRHLREPVRFADGMSVLAEKGFTTFLELGPGATLSGLGARCLKQQPGMTFLTSLRRDRPDWHELLASLGALFAAGAPIDWAACDRGFSWRGVSLPTYPFERERYWVDSVQDAASPVSQGASGLSRTASSAPGTGPEGHPLLGRRLRSASHDAQFEQRIGAGSPAFLADHVIHGRVVVPATAFVEMMRAAADDGLGTGARRLRDLAIAEPLVLDGMQPRLVQTIVTHRADGSASAEIFSGALDQGVDGPWTLHAAASLSQEAPGARADPDDTLAGARSRCTVPWPVEDLYAWYGSRGIQYGERFACLDRVWSGNGEAIGAVRWPESVSAEAAAYGLHPAILDACMQTVAAALRDGEGAGGSFVPVNIEEVVVHRGGGPMVWSHVRLHQADAAAGTLTSDLFLFDANERLVAELRGLRARAISADAWGGAGAVPDDGLYEIAWEAGADSVAVTASLDAAATWIMIGDPNGLGVSLARRIADGGGRARLVAAEPQSAAVLDPSRPNAPDAVDRYDEVCRESSTLSGQCVFVYLDSLDGPGIHLGDAVAQVAAASMRGCDGLLRLARGIGAHNRGARLVVVTSGAQTAIPGAGADPAQAAVWSIARTVRAEQPETRCTCVDLDSQDRAGSLDGLWHLLLTTGGDEELALRDGRRYTPRLVPSAFRARGSADATPSSFETRVLGISSRGVLDNLQISTEPRRTPGPGEVEVKIAAAALNFRDVLNALGMYPGDAGPLGGECAGTVVRVGPNVQHLRAGDEVVGMPAGAFRNYVTAGTDRFVRKPAALSMAASATVPIAFLTAEYALTRLAGMRRGERVLVHAGTGGVGLAAIQLARRAGAEVFATAGSDEKRAYLRDLGVAHVFSSRTLSFADEILSATGGAGVDVVLNSLAGDFITESVRALGRGGRFVEIGKGGIWTAGQMAAARPDVAYFPLYLGDVGPAVTLPMLTTLLTDVAEDRLAPLPHRAFELDRAVDAFRHMAQARHIGKVLLSCGDPVAVHADATYIVTGGFGALGGAVARTLAARGARHLVLVGRRPISDPPAAELIAGLRASGVRVEAVSADIAEAAGADEVFRVASQGPPLRGIVHAAGVVDDGLLEQQSSARFERVFRPKALGAWQMHERSRQSSLDFFVLFSSGASLLPMPGQANYAAANGFLDALAHARRAAGLPAVSINWGPWAGAGMAAHVTGSELRRWQRQGIRFIPETRGLEVLASALAGGPAQLCMLPVDWPAFAASYREDRCPRLVSELTRRTAVPVRRQPPPSVSLLERLRDLPPSERKRAVNEQVCDAVRRVLAVPRSFVLEPHQGLRDLGMDSLIAVELRNDLQRTADRSLPSTLAFDCPSIEALTEFLWVLLSPEPAAAAVAAGSALTGTPRAGGSSDIRGLSDADAEALLAEELNR